MKNGAAKRTRQDDRFGAGRSREAEQISDALGEQSDASAADGGSGGSSPSEEEIARRAYERYLTRGGADGSPEQDWLAAEDELRRERQRG